jgi:hypothetical protein
MTAWQFPARGSHATQALRLNFGFVHTRSLCLLVDCYAPTCRCARVSTPKLLGHSLDLMTMSLPTLGTFLSAGRVKL